jgi:hypothetical protein
LLNNQDSKTLNDDRRRRPDNPAQNIRHPRNVRILPRSRISLSYRYSRNTLTCHTREKRMSSTPQLRDRPAALAVYGLIAVVLMLLIRIKGFVKLVAPAACTRRI